MTLNQTEGEHPFNQERDDDRDARFMEILARIIPELSPQRESIVLRLKHLFKGPFFRIQKYWLPHINDVDNQDAIQYIEEELNLLKKFLGNTAPSIKSEMRNLGIADTEAKWSVIQKFSELTGEEVTTENVQEGLDAVNSIIDALY